MTQNRKPSFLIAGLGSIGQRHLRNLTALGVEDITLYRTGKSTLANPELDRFPVVHDLDEGLAKKPSAVMVSNPTSMHMEVALKAAEAGCHLFLEKPVSHTMDGMEDLRALVKAGGLKVFVGFQARFHPSLRQIRRWVDEGRIGKLVSAHARWREYLPGWHPWEDYRKSYSARSDLGGGVTLTLCHPFDYLRMMFGEVISLHATVGHLSRLKLDSDDTSMVTLNFASGAVGSVYLDYVSRPVKQDLIVVCDLGTITWDAAEASAVLFDGESGETETSTLPEGFERNTLFMEEMAHFLECITGNAEPLCSLEDGIRALEIVLAAKRSSEERRTIDLVR